VVNFIFKKDFSGVELNAHEGISSRGDGQEFNLNGVIGVDSADNRGNVTIYAGYLKRDPVFSSQRDYAAVALTEDGAGNLIPGGSSAILGGRLVGLAGPSLKFETDGSLQPYSFSADHYNYNPPLNLQVPQTQKNITAIGHYDISEAMTVYTELTYIDAHTHLQGPPQPAFAIPVTMQVNSPFFPAATQAYLRGFDPTNTGYVNAGLTRRLSEFGNEQFDYDRSAYRAVFGVKGDLGDGWKYDTYFNYSENHTDNTYQGTISTVRLQESLYTAFTNPATLSSNTPTISTFPIAGLAGGGTLICADAIARASGCVPADLYGQNRISQAGINYLAETLHSNSKTSTEVVSALLNSSEIFSIPFGGPVGVAIGGEYRRLTASSNPDSAQISGDAVGQGSASPLSGGYDVAEVFGELNAVLLKDQPLVESLEFNAAGRYSNYSLNGTGGVESWSGGLVYKPVQEFGFRTQYQRATRAPNVGELFSGQSLTQVPGVDPCNGAKAGTTLGSRCLATGVPSALLGTILDPNTQLNDLVGGNPKLGAEKSNTWTSGIVVAPDFLPGFTGTLDYYNTSISNYISQVGGATISQLCYQQNLTAYCNQIVRSPIAGNIQQIQDTLANAGSFKSAGEDLDLEYTTPLTFGEGLLDGLLGVQSRLTHLEERTLTPVAALPTVQNVCAGKFGVICGNPSPNWKAQTNISWKTGPLTITGQWDYLGSVRDDGGLGYQVAVTKIPAFNYFNLSGQYEFTDWLEVTAGVINLGDKLPPVMGDNSDANWANSWPATYDTIGRRFFVNVTSRF
jgi:iron complex outermembrane recepter protein